LIFSSIDRDLFWANLLDADPVALAAGLLMFFPIISGSVERWRWMLHDHADLPFWTGVKIFLAATSLNSVVPSKLGDLGKAVFLHNQGITDLERTSNSVLRDGPGRDPTVHRRLRYRLLGSPADPLLGDVPRSARTETHRAVQRVDSHRSPALSGRLAV
jgi:hypothetical protein